MALNKAQLKQEISDLMTDMQSREENAIDEFATRLSDSIDDYVKGMQITYTAGLVSPSGPVTGTSKLHLAMKGFAIQLEENGSDVLDLKINVKRDSFGKIDSGLTIGSTLEQNKALLLIAQPGEFKDTPALGVGLSDALLGDDMLQYRHRIRKQFQKDGLNITRLDLYKSDKIKIEANY